MATPIVTDGSIDRTPQAPRVVLPTRADVFGARADRFAALAADHPMAAYLELMAEVARAQQAAFEVRRGEPVAEKALAASRDYGMPPLSAQAHERSAMWREDLHDIARRVRARSANGVAATLERVLRLEVPVLESLADRVLAGTTLDDDAAVVPFVGAALQVYFARLAASLDVASVDHCDVPGICPVCASRPVASVVRIGGEQANLRFLRLFAVRDRVEHGADQVQRVRLGQGRAVPFPDARREREGDKLADARGSVRRVQELPEDLLPGQGREGRAERG